MIDKPAFPHQIQHRPTRTETWEGMTLRQWYKGMAMQGLLARVDDRSEGHTMEPLTSALSQDDGGEVAHWVAFLSSRLADAMLAEDEQYEKDKR